MHFFGRVKNLVSHFFCVPAGVRGVVLCALMFFAGAGTVWSATYSTNTTISYSDFAAGDTITINTNATLTINLMGQNVSVGTINIGSGGSAGNLIINGPGTLNVGSFDPDEKVKNRIEINNYANLVVTGTFWADKDKDAADAVTIITGDRTGSLSITGKVDYSTKNDSGVFFDTVNVNVLSDIDNLVKYSWDNIKASISEGIGLTVNRTFKGQANKENISYKVVFSNSTRANVTGSIEFTKETGVTESKTVSQDILISFNTDPAGEHDFENTGDSAILTLYAPDGVTELATIAYYYQLPVWNGSKSTDGYDVENWGLDAETYESELLGLFKSNQIMLNSGLARYPVFDVAEKSVEFNSLVVSSGASVTVSAGQLTAGALTVNGSGVMKTTGGTLTISGNSTISNLNLGSAMNVTGGTTVITSLKTNAACSVEISSGAEVDVTNSYLGENCSGKLSWNGTGNLTIPRSGANVDFGAPVPDYGAKLEVKAAGAATYYSANDLTADGSLILTRVSGSSTGDVRYPYTLNTTTVTKKVSIAGTEYNSSSLKSEYFEVPSGSANKSFTVSGLSDIDDNSSFIMTFYSPDGKFSLGSISYTKTSADAIYWNGTISSDWCTIDNWTRPDGVDVTTDDWQAYDLVVGPTIKDTSTPIARFPNVNNTNTAKSVTILGGAHVTMDDGTNLTIGDIKCMGDAYFSATQGTVNFSDGASFTAANPDNSNFNNVKVLGDFTVNSKMSVAKDFSAEGLGGKKITLNDNVIVGKDLLLSGTSDGSLLTIRTDQTNTGGAGNYFKISNTQNYGMYLSVADELKIGENGESSSVVYKAYYCDKDSDADKDPRGWVLSKGAPNEFVWTGKKSAVWDDEENWSPKIIPVAADVVIPDRLANYPNLSAAITEKSICIGEKEGSNAKIELNRFGFTVTGTTAGAFTNYGTVVCIENELDAVVMPAESGAVIENGTWQFNWAGANVKKIENHSYKNILISNQANIFGDGGDIVAEKITINTSSKHSIKSSVKVTADIVLATDSQFDTSGTNDFTITGNISGGRTLQIISNGTFKIAGNADVGNFSTSGNAVFAGNFNASGTISVSGTTQFEGSGVSIISGGTQTFNGKLTVNSDVDFVAGTSVTPSSVIFNSTVDDGASSDSDRHSVVIGSTSVESSAVFQGIVGGNSELKNLQVKGSASGNVADKIVISSKNSSFAGFKDGTNLTVNGNADIYGDNSFTAFALSGNANIYGNNIFSSIVIDNSSADAETTVKFANGTTQTIQNDWSGAENIPFKGKSDGAELLFTSIDAYTPETPNPWKVVFSNSGISRDNFSYVKIQNCSSSTPLNIRQQVEKIVDAGNNTNWFAPTSFKWKGSVDGNWSEVANWVDSSDVIVAVCPDYFSGFDEVVIDTAAGGKNLDMASVSSDSVLKLKSLNVPEGKWIGIAGHSISADEITVNGTVAVYGNQASYPLVVNNSGSVIWGDSSVIEYYGAVDGSDVLFVSSSTDAETGIKSQTYKSLFLNKTGDKKITFENAVSAASLSDTGSNTVYFKRDAVVITDVTFNGKVHVDSSATTFKLTSPNVSIESTGSFTADCGDNSEVTISGVLTNNGSFTASTGAGAKTIITGDLKNNGSFSASGGVTKIGGSVELYDASSSFIHNNGKVVLNGSTSQVLSVKPDGSTSLYDLEIASGAVVTAKADFTIQRNFTNDGTYNAGADSTDEIILTVDGDFTNSGTFTANKGTVKFSSGASPHNISGECSFNDVVLGDDVRFVAGTAGSDGKIIINSTLSSSDETIRTVMLGSNEIKTNLVFGSVSDVSLSSIKIGTDEKGSLISSNGTIIFANGFVDNSSVELDCSAQISGDNIFKSFACNKNGAVLSFEAGKTQKIVAEFKISSEGSSESEYVTLQSQTEGLQWKLYSESSNNSVIKANIKDSAFLPGKIIAYNSTDKGKNTNWIFDTLYTWVGIDSKWLNLSNWEPSAIPGEGGKVLIPNLDVGKKYPVLSAEINLAVLEVESKAEISLNGKAFAIQKNGLDDCHYTNKGKIILTGAETINISSDAVVNESGLWSYSGGKITKPDNFEFNDIEIAGEVHVSENLNLNSLSETESGKLTLESTCAEIRTLGNQVYDGTVILKGDVEFNAALKDIKFLSGVETQGHKINVSAENIQFGSEVFGSEVANGFADDADAVLTGNSEIYGDNIFRELKIIGNSVLYGSNEYEKLTVDNSSLARESYVKFAARKLQKFREASFSGAADARLILESTSADPSEKWIACFKDGITEDAFAYTTVKLSESLNEDDLTPKMLGLNKSSEKITGDTNVTYWFRSLIFYWTGAVDSNWSNVMNWKDENDMSVYLVPDFTSGLETVYIETIVEGNDLDLAISGFSEKILKLKSLSIPEGKRMQIAGNYIQADSIKIDGTIALAGTQTSYPLKVNGSGAIIWGDNSVIEYKSDADESKPVLFVSENSEDGTLIFNNLKISAKNIGFDNSVTAENILISSSEKVTFNKITTVTGDLAISGSNFVHNNGKFVFAGNNGNLVINSEDSAVFNDFEILSGAICNVQGDLFVAGNFVNNGTYNAGISESDSYVLKIGKNYENNGNFNAYSGTVEFTGSEPSVVFGATKWHNIKVIEPGKTLIFEAGKLQEISGDFEISGNADKNVILKSSSEGESWQIKVLADAEKVSVKYADVKDSECKDCDIHAYDSTDSGNNIGWIFHGMTYSWNGANYGVWSVKENWMPASVPGKYAKAVIPAGKAAKADMNIEIANLILEENAVIDAADFCIYLDSGAGKIENAGILKLKGIESQIKGTVENLAGSTVVYYGGIESKPSKNVIKEDYFNLKISDYVSLGNVSDSSESKIKVNGSLEIDSSTVYVAFESDVAINKIVVSAEKKLDIKENLEIGEIEEKESGIISIEFCGVAAGGSKKEQKFIYSAESSKRPLKLQNLVINSNSIVKTDISLEIFGKWENKGEYLASDGYVKIMSDGEISGINNFNEFVFEKTEGNLLFTGKNTYRILSITAPGGEIIFPSGEDNKQIVHNLLKFNGSDEKLLNIKSASSGSRNGAQWFIDCYSSDSADIKYVRVSDSYANKDSEVRLVAKESRNGGNNINWVFPGLDFAFTAAAVGQNQLYIVFDRPIDFEKSNLKETLFFINKEGQISDLEILNASVKYNSEESTSYVCTLSRTVQFADIVGLYLVYRSDTKNYIATPTSDFMSDNESHAISDFAVNAVDALYAYDNRQVDLPSKYFNTGYSIEESLAVHDWNEEQQRMGTLLYNSDIFVSAKLNYQMPFEDSEKISEKVVMYYDNAPDFSAESAVYNSYFSKKLRVWLPQTLSSGEKVEHINKLSQTNNAVKGFVIAESSNGNYKFDIPKDKISLENGVKSGEQIKFIFGLEDRKICRKPKVTGTGTIFTVDDTEKSPLFALRLKNSHDISSLDLWSFRLKEITAQRGGVTILNNVIDTSRGDIATVKVDMSGAGSLSVIVMTLDGNVVQYLQHGTASAGEHFYSWNGKTKGGKTVARGLYFVRVIGSGFDETRKIMVVRE